MLDIHLLLKKISYRREHEKKLPPWLNDPNLAQIGVSTYFPVTSLPQRLTKDQALNAWKQQVKTKLDAFAQRIGKPLVLTEIGYTNTHHAGYTPWTLDSSGHDDDLDERRSANMDAAGIDMQVLSLTAPGTEQMDAVEAIASAINDFLAQAVSRHPGRLAGFATLPTPDPEAAAAELERVVQTYGFKGALINGHIRGRYLDDPFFWPILECAEALHVPLYLHPTRPPQAVATASYTGNFAPEVTSALANSAWGWHIETAIHVLRIVLSGAFDRYPNLQLVIGHLGEGLPFMMPRAEFMLSRQLTKLERPLGAYLRENLHYTFGGFNFLPPFLDLLAEVGANHILFSADYPYASMTQAHTFLDQLPVSPADKEQIAHGNAERLLKL